MLGRVRRTMDIDHSTDGIRQGESGHGVRYMLGFGTLLAIVAMVIVVMIVV